MSNARKTVDAGNVLAALKIRDDAPLVVSLPDGATAAAVIIVKTVMPDGETDIEVASSAGCDWYDQAALIREAAAAVDRAAMMRAMRMVRDEGGGPG